MRSGVNMSDMYVTRQKNRLVITALIEEENKILDALYAAYNAFEDIYYPKMYIPDPNSLDKHLTEDCNKQQCPALQNSTRLQESP